MADAPSGAGIVATLLALGLAPTVGMMLGGGWVAAFAFVAAATIVTMRALGRHRRALREPDPLGAQLTAGQAIGMLSAMRGLPLAPSALGRVEVLTQLAERDPAAAHAGVVALLAEAPRNVAALVLCARLAFALQHDDAPQRWAEALRIALDTGLNRVAAMAFVAHREHREALRLGAGHAAALANALGANGHAADATWCRAYLGHRA